MRGLIQRVTHANVKVDGDVIGQIDHGILLLLGVEADDTDVRCKRLVERVLNYRIFPDSKSRMNLNLQQIKGQLLVVSQFTLVADTTRGNRPGFSKAASPEKGLQLYRSFLTYLDAYDVKVATGEFGADMKIELVNDGPVTFLLEA